MFLKGKTHIHEVLKWGIFSGLIESAYIFLAGILYSQKQEIFALGSASFFFIFLVVLSAIISTLVVFAHPLYLAQHEQYKDALLTVLMTVVTIAVFVLFFQFAFSQIGL